MARHPRIARKRKSNKEIELEWNKKLIKEGNTQNSFISATGRSVISRREHKKRINQNKLNHIHILKFINKIYLGYAYKCIYCNFWCLK